MRNHNSAWKISVSIFYALKNNRIIKKTAIVHLPVSKLARLLKRIWQKQTTEVLPW